MYKVFIGVGHGGKDCGAVANGLKESDVNLTIALAMADVLVRNGINVKLSRSCDEDDKLQDEINECNAFAPDIAVEIHNNAGGGDGFEVYYQTNQYQSKSKKLAEHIEKRVIELGQNSRGIKNKKGTNGLDYFGWLRQCKCIAVLCEGFFLDNIKDKQIADTEQKQRKFGCAYALAVLDYFGIKLDDKRQDLQSNANSIYRVQVGAFTDETNAKKLQSELKEKGYQAIIK